MKVTISVLEETGFLKPRTSLSLPKDWDKINDYTYVGYFDEEYETAYNYLRQFITHIGRNLDTLDPKDKAPLYSVRLESQSDLKFAIIALTGREIQRIGRHSDFNKLAQKRKYTSYDGPVGSNMQESQLLYNNGWKKSKFNLVYPGDSRDAVRNWEYVFPEKNVNDCFHYCATCSYCEIHKFN